MDFAYLIFILALVLLGNFNRIEKALNKRNSVKNSQPQQTKPSDLYAHNLVMETGEILSRPPSERYPAMELNQAKVKLYYNRVKDSPVQIGMADQSQINNEKPNLVIVK